MNPTFIYAVALAVAAVTLYGAVRACSRRSVADGDSWGSAPPEIRVLTRNRVGRGRVLVVVEVEGRRLLLGSTREQWCTLADLGGARDAMGVDPYAPFDAELERAAQAIRHPKRWKDS